MVFKSGRSPIGAATHGRAQLFYRILNSSCLRSGTERIVEGDAVQSLAGGLEGIYPFVARIYIAIAVVMCFCPVVFCGVNADVLVFVRAVCVNTRSEEGEGEGKADGYVVHVASADAPAWLCMRRGERIIIDIFYFY